MGCFRKSRLPQQGDKTDKAMAAAATACRKASCRATILLQVGANDKACENLWIRIGYANNIGPLGPGLSKPLLSREGWTNVQPDRGAAQGSRFGWMLNLALF